MGIETAIAAGAVGSSLLGGVMQYGENRAARKRQQGVQDQIQGQLNSGQDSFLQYLRADPTALKPFQFDASQAFKDLQAQDTLNTNDQVAQLRSGAGSLGARFGSGFAAHEAMLRSRISAANDARNAGIEQSSFTNALNAGMSDFNGAQGRKMQLLQMLQGGSGMQLPSAGAVVGQTGGDIGSLLTLLQYLNKSGGGGGGGGNNRVPTAPVAPSVVNYGPQP